MYGSDFSALYAISDIHGCASAFLSARRLIARDSQGYPGRKLVVLLGDYVDRGPASRDVLELLTQPISEEIEDVALCGNHDDQLVKMVRGDLPIDAWLEFAGSATLTSFGIDVENVLKRVGLKGLHHVVRETIPTAYISRLEALPVSLQIDNLLFVHAGVRPGVALASQTDNDLMWIREPFLENGPQLPIFVIHGHTPGITVNIGNARLGIDTAAVATGKLTFLGLSGRSSRQYKRRIEQLMESGILAKTENVSSSLTSAIQIERLQRATTQTGSGYHAFQPPQDSSRDSVRS